MQVWLFLLLLLLSFSGGAAAKGINLKIGLSDAAIEVVNESVHSKPAHKVQEVLIDVGTLPPIPAAIAHAEIEHTKPIPAIEPADSVPATEHAEPIPTIEPADYSVPIEHAEPIMIPATEHAEPVIIPAVEHAAPAPVIEPADSVPIEHAEPITIPAAAELVAPIHTEPIPEPAEPVPATIEHAEPVMIPAVIEHAEPVAIEPAAPVPVEHAEPLPAAIEHGEDYFMSHRALDSEDSMNVIKNLPMTYFFDVLLGKFRFGILGGNLVNSQPELVSRVTKKNPIKEKGKAQIFYDVDVVESQSLFTLGKFIWCVCVCMCLCMYVSVHISLH